MNSESETPRCDNLVLISTLGDSHELETYILYRVVKLNGLKKFLLLGSKTKNKKLPRLLQHTMEQFPMQTTSPLLFSAICPGFTANYHQQTSKFQDHLPATKRKFTCFSQIKGVSFIRTQSSLTKSAQGKFKVLPRS